MTDAASDDRGEPVGWLDSVTLQGSDTPVRAVLDGRDGNRVFVRQADPSDGDPPRVPVFEGDEIVVMTTLAAVGHHLTEEVGRIDDLVTSARIVPVRREGNKVFARTLNYGELDDGDRVHVRPGDELIFEEGSVVLELEAIDAKESSCRAENEYVPITPVLWSWLVCGGVHDEAKARYLLAAARRLDAASVLLAEVERLRGELAQENLSGPIARRALFGLIAAVELAVIALGRVCDMVEKAGPLIGSSVPVPATIVTKRKALNELRNAYEHIEDRALGKVLGKPHPDALTIFNHDQLLRHDRISYAGFSLDLTHETPAMIAEARGFLKGVAGNS
ncbi:MAG: hypothetical protein WCB73_10215 [Pseudonocardiaceae bacterium]